MKIAGRTKHSIRTMSSRAKLLTIDVSWNLGISKIDHDLIFQNIECCRDTAEASQ